MSEEDKVFVALLINRTGSSSCMEALLVIGRAVDKYIKTKGNWNTERFSSDFEVIRDSAVGLADAGDVLVQLVVP